jgi:hypothetical protein
VRACARQMTHMIRHLEISKPSGRNTAAASHHVVLGDTANMEKWPIHERAGVRELRVRHHPGRTAKPTNQLSAASGFMILWRRRENLRLGERGHP